MAYLNASLLTKRSSHLFHTLNNGIALCLFAVHSDDNKIVILINTQ